MIQRHRDILRSTNTELMWPPRVDRAAMLDRVTGKTIEKGNDRLRAFAPVILDRNTSEGIMRVVRDSGEQEGVSRVAMRGLVSPKDVERVVASAEFVGMHEEGRIPVNGLLLMYFGRNSDERKVLPETKARQQASASSIMARGPKTRELLLEVIAANGYRFDDNLGSGDFPRLVELYGTCLPRYCVNLDSGKLAELFKNPGNAFAIIREQGRIIAAAVAEQSVIEIAGASVHDVEISECVTDPEHRSRGLMSAIIYRLIESIRGNENTVIYSESRAGIQSINCAMRNNAMIHCGWLEKAVVIGEQSPIEDEGQFNHMESLNVWAFRRV